jgi:hypothetical protein
MHRIRVKLYPNYLPGGEGTYLARTDSEATLSVEEVCAADRDRGGLTGNFDDYVGFVKRFFRESSYQLADGYAINTGAFSIYPNLGGTFVNIDETPDPKKHPLTFRFRAHKPLRELAGHIAVVVDGEADPSGHITEFLDNENNSVNHWYEPGNQFMLTGHKIKIAGDDPSCGMYIVPVEYNDPPVKVTRIIENGAGKIIGVIPNAEWEKVKIEIRTQFAGSGGVFLKSPRVITSKFTLEQA